MVKCMLCAEPCEPVGADAAWFPVCFECHMGDLIRVIEGGMASGETAEQIADRVWHVDHPTERTAPEPDGVDSRGLRSHDDAVELESSEG